MKGLDCSVMSWTVPKVLGLDWKYKEKEWNFDNGYMTDGKFMGFKVFGEETIVQGNPWTVFYGAVCTRDFQPFLRHCVPTKSQIVLF